MEFLWLIVFIVDFIGHLLSADAKMHSFSFSFIVICCNFYKFYCKFTLYVFKKNIIRSYSIFDRKRNKSIYIPKFKGEVLIYVEFRPIISSYFMRN